MNSIVCLIIGLYLCLSVISSSANTEVSKIVFPENIAEESYSITPFDIKDRKLPLQYYGHNPERVYEGLKSIEENKQKREFETTEQYKKRIQKEVATPMVGSLYYDSIYAFQIDFPAIDDDIKYNADTSILKVNIRFSLVRDGIRIMDDRRGLSTTKMTLFKSSYYANNAYGVTVKVDKTTWNRNIIDVINWRDFPFAELGFSEDGLIIYAINEKIPMEFDTAKKLKESKQLRALALCRLLPPFISSGGKLKKPTIDNPKDFALIEQYLIGELLEIWLYDFSTGNVLWKIAKKKN